MSYNPEKGLSQIGIFHYSSALAHALWQQRPRILSNMPQFPFSDEVLGWDPRIHSGEDNLRWSWLRAVEWGRWPIFLSQPLAPVLLIWWPWHIVVVTVFVANCLWAGFVRNFFVSRWLATLGIYVVAARWVTWPSSVIYLFVSHKTPEAWVALAWPTLIFAIGSLTPSRVGRLQADFMRSLGQAGGRMDGLTSSSPGAVCAAVREVSDGAFGQKIESLMAATASVLNILDIWLEPKALGWGINVRGRTVAAFVTFGAAESALTKVRAAVESRLSNNGARGDPMPPTFLPDRLMKICGLFVSTSHKTQSVRRLPSKITTGNYMPALFCLPDTWCTIQTTVTASRCQYVSLMAAAISLVLSFVVTWWILVGVAVGVFSAMWCGKVVREGWMYLGAVLLGMEILTTDFCGWGSAYPQVRLQALQHLNCDTGHASTTWLDYYLPNRDQMSPETSRSFGPGEVS